MKEKSSKYMSGAKFKTQTNSGPSAHGCSAFTRPPDSRSEENVKISDDGSLSPGNRAQKSGREGWSSQVDLQ